MNRKTFFMNVKAEYTISSSQNINVRRTSQVPITQNRTAQNLAILSKNQAIDQVSLRKRNINCHLYPLKHYLDQVPPS